MAFTKSQQDRLGMAVIAASIAIILAVVVVTAVVRSSKKDNLNPDTFCPYQVGYAHTVVLIDKTDLFSPDQQSLIRAKILEIQKKLRVQEKLSIYVLDDKNYLAPRPAFAVCNPGSDQDANPLYQSPRQFKKKYEEYFGKPLDGVISQLSTGSVAKSSPILEMVHSVSQVYDFGRSASTRKLVIFSDLMQNTSEFSQLNGGWNYSHFREMPYANRLKPDLRDVDVEVIYLLRPELYRFQSDPMHQRFWGNWFEENGAKEIKFQRAA